MKIRRITTIGMAVLAAGAIATTTAGLAAASDVAAPAPGQVVVIDGNADPGTANDALKLFPTDEDTITKDHATFTPTTDPTYGAAAWKIAQYRDSKGNLVDVPAIIGGTEEQGLKVTVEHTESATATVGGSLEIGRGIDLAGVVDAELSFKFTASHSWESESTTKQGIWFHAKPGKTVVLMTRDNTATFTGDFQWDINGVHYVVKNVTITQPAAAADAADGTSPTNYLVKEYDNTQTGATTAGAGSTENVAALPQLKQLVSSLK